MQHSILLDYWGGTTTFKPTPDMFDGRWHYVVTTYDGGSAIAYVDGVEMGPPNALDAPKPTSSSNTTTA